MSMPTQAEHADSLPQDHNSDLPATPAIATPRLEQINHLPVVECTPNQNPLSLANNPPHFSFSGGSVLFPNLNREHTPIGPLTTILPGAATAERRKRSSDSSTEMSIAVGQPERITKVRVVGTSVQSEDLVGLRNKNGRLKRDATKYREEARVFHEEIQRQRSETVRREEELLRLARSEIEDRERRACEAERQLQDTKAQAESCRQRMIQDRKKREEELHRLRVEVEHLKAASHRSGPASAVLQSRQQAAAGTPMGADEQEVKDILLPGSVYVDIDEDMEDGIRGPDHAEPVSAQSPVESQPTEVNGQHDIVEEGDGIQYKETRTWRKQEKGKAWAFGVESEGRNMQGRHISINDDTNDKDDREDKGGDQDMDATKFADLIPFEEHMEDIHEGQPPYVRDDTREEEEEEEEEGEEGEEEEAEAEAEEVVVEEEDEDEDEDEEKLVEEANPPPRREYIHRPTKFARPKGGQGPPLTGHFMKSSARSKAPPAPAGSSRSANPSSSRSTFEEPSIQEMFRIMLDGLNDLQDRMGNNAASGRLTNPNKNKHIPRGRFKTPRETPVRNSQRALLLSRVRAAMNDCMGISHDTDINEQMGAPKQAVVAFKQGLEPGPVLRPMHIDWSGGRTSRWNQSLFKDFLQYFLRDVEDKRPRISTNAQEIEKIFYSRLDRLRRRRKCMIARDGEGVEDVEKRLWMAKRVTLKHQRQKTRQRQLYLARREIALSNREYNGVVDQGWDFLFSVVDSLGIDGMSSDESEVDQDKKKSFRVKKRAWRSKKIEKMLRRVDKDRNTKNVYGNDRQGNTPRTRNRPAYSDSVGEAIRGLPCNFYDPLWYHKLSKRDKEDLGVLADVDMLVLEDE